MTVKQKKTVVAAVLIVALLVIDQIIKIWVKTHMTLGEQIVIAPWFRIQFIENRGMAWGMELGSKLFLSLFRIVAVGFIIWYIVSLIRRNVKWGYLTMICLICAGAAGNIFDSVVYGQIFTASTPFDVAQLVPWGQGYNTQLLSGSVVDMFYFPLWHGTMPDWMPIGGGREFTFFNAIFNFADACITVGVICLLIFYNKTLSTDLDRDKRKGRSGDDGSENDAPDDETSDTEEVEASQASSSADADAATAAASDVAATTDTITENK